MKISFSIDEPVVEQARQAAQAMDKSLEQVLLDFVIQLAGRAPLETGIADYLESTARTAGRMDGWRFNRDELQRCA